MGMAPMKSKLRGALLMYAAIFTAAGSTECLVFSANSLKSAVIFIGSDVLTTFLKGPLAASYKIPHTVNAAVDLDLAVASLDEVPLAACPLDLIVCLTCIALPLMLDALTCALTIACLPLHCSWPHDFMIATERMVIVYCLNTNLILLLASLSLRLSI
jgi:hypothetical protein